MAYDVLVVGRPSCDIIFTGLPRWPSVGREIYAQDLIVSAGGGFNMVAALHRLGLRAGMIGTVGSDEWSERGLRAMEAEGVSTALMRVLDRPLPAVSVCMTHEGDRGFLTYEPPAAADDSRGHALAMIRRERATHLACYLTPDLPIYAAAARERGMRLAVDCGWDEPWLTSRQIRDLMPLADLLFANEPEACAVAGTVEPAKALRCLGEIVPFVVVKQGVAGASALVEGRAYHVPTEPVTVVDATGAGDCFNAGFLYGLLRGCPVEESLRLGNICGGMNVAVPGGYAGAPTETELIARARAHGVALEPREGKSAS